MYIILYYIQYIIYCLLYIKYCILYIIYYTLYIIYYILYIYITYDILYIRYYILDVTATIGNVFLYLVSQARECWICRDVGSEPLIHPCACRGSAQPVGSIALHRIFHQVGMGQNPGT